MTMYCVDNILACNAEMVYAEMVYAMRNPEFPLCIVLTI